MFLRVVEFAELDERQVRKVGHEGATKPRVVTESGTVVVVAHSYAEVVELAGDSVGMEHTTEACTVEGWAHDIAVDGRSGIGSVVDAVVVGVADNDTRYVADSDWEGDESPYGLPADCCSC